MKREAVFSAGLNVKTQATVTVDHNLKYCRLLVTTWFRLLLQAQYVSKMQVKVLSPVVKKSNLMVLQLTDGAKAI